MSDDDEKNDGSRRKPGESLTWLPDLDPIPGKPTPTSPTSALEPETETRETTSPGLLAAPLESLDPSEHDDLLKTQELTALGVQAYLDHSTGRVVALARQSDRYWSTRVKARLELARRLLPDENNGERSDIHDVIAELCDIIEEMSERFGY